MNRRQRGENDGDLLEEIAEQQRLIAELERRQAAQSLEVIGEANSRTHRSGASSRGRGEILGVQRGVRNVARRGLSLMARGGSHVDRGSVIPPPMAMATQGAAYPKPANKVNQSEDNHCFACGSFGHFARDCPGEGKTRCYKCKTWGHIQWDCPNEHLGVRRNEPQADSGDNLQNRGENPAVSNVSAMLAHTKVASAGEGASEKPPQAKVLATDSAPAIRKPEGTTGGGVSRVAALSAANVDVMCSALSSYSNRLNVLKKAKLQAEETRREINAQIEEMTAEVKNLEALVQAQKRRLKEGLQDCSKVLQQGEIDKPAKELKRKASAIATVANRKELPKPKGVIKPVSANQAEKENEYRHVKKASKVEARRKSELPPLPPGLPKLTVPMKNVPIQPLDMITLDLEEELQSKEESSSQRRSADENLGEKVLEISSASSGYDEDLGDILGGIDELVNVEANTSNADRRFTWSPTSFIPQPFEYSQSRPALRCGFVDRAVGRQLIELRAFWRTRAGAAGKLLPGDQKADELIREIMTKIRAATTAFPAWSLYIEVIRHLCEMSADQGVFVDAPLLASHYTLWFQKLKLEERALVRQREARRRRDRNREKEQEAQKANTEETNQASTSAAKSGDSLEAGEEEEVFNDELLDGFDQNPESIQERWFAQLSMDGETAAAILQEFHVFTNELMTNSEGRAVGVTRRQPTNVDLTEVLSVSSESIVDLTEGEEGDKGD